MVGYVLKAAVALIGLFLIRGLVYPRSWTGRTIPNVLFAVVGAALLVPLATSGGIGPVVVLAAAVLALFPYRRVAVAFLKARTRQGLKSLADRWDTVLEEDAESGRWEVERKVDGRRMWVGNVLTHKGAIDPRVRRKETAYMLAFVIELEREPPFLCSLMIGWEKPRYFEREWRATHVIHGEFLALPFGDIGLESDRGRATGGQIADLAPYDLPAELPRGLVAVGTEPEAFARTIDHDLLRQFGELAVQTYPYELNVTPSSVNIYTTYCGPEVQLANLRFIEALARRLDGTG